MIGWIDSWMGELPLVVQIIIGLASIALITLLALVFPAYQKWVATKGKQIGNWLADKLYGDAPRN